MSSRRSTKRRLLSHCSNQAGLRDRPWRQASPPCATWDRETIPYLACNRRSTQDSFLDPVLSRQDRRFAWSAAMRDLSVKKWKEPSKSVPSHERNSPLELPSSKSLRQAVC